MFQGNKPMILFLKNKLSLNLFPCLLQLPSYSTSATLNPPPKSNLVADYLIEKCGFSPKKAAAASKRINFTSPSKPDSVRHFLKHHVASSDAHVNSIVSRSFYILCADIDKTIEPNLEAVRRITTWSCSEIEQVVIANPSILANPRAISRLEFWKDYLNGDMKKLLTAAKGNLGIFCHDIDKSVAKMALLKEYGLSQNDLQMLLVTGRGFFCKSVASIKVLLKRVEKLGLPCQSRMFTRCLLLFSYVGPDAFNSKMKLFKKYGWSEKEFLGAVSKAPFFVGLSDENIREKMEFLVGKAGCDKFYIVSRPVLLMYSLEKRLMPRLLVMNILKSHNLLGMISFNTIMCISESKFIERFVYQNKEKLPVLRDIYNAACAFQVDL